MAKQKINPQQSSSELGYAEVTAAQTSITTITDLTGLSVTVNTTTAMTIMVEGWLPQVYGTVGTDRCAFSIYEGSTELATAYTTIGGQGIGGLTVRKRISAPTAGSHTYKLRLARDSGSGAASVYSDANTRAFIQVRTV